MKEIKPIGKDVFNVIGFRFGMFRYQIEYFDHNKTEGVKHDNTDCLKCESYYDTLYGTKIYKFQDNEYKPTVWKYLVFNKYIEEEELKEMILQDKIEWNLEDPYDFKDLIVTDRWEIMFDNMFYRDKEKVNHGYPECEFPYNKCPCCGAELDEDVTDPEYAIDCYNAHSFASPDGECGSAEEIYRCTHCGKLFYVLNEW